MNFNLRVRGIGVMFITILSHLLQKLHFLLYPYGTGGKKNELKL